MIGIGKSAEAEAQHVLVRKKDTKIQIVLGLLANFSSIAPSMSLGFSAIAIPILTKVGNPNIISAEQASWFASIASLATPFGSIFSGPICDRFGRRSALFVVNITCFIGWLTIAAAYYMNGPSQYAVLLIGRLLTGFSTGISSMPATVYMSEISSVKLRGVFTTWSSISFSLGVLLVYSLGYFLKDYWGTIALITAVFPCIGMLFAVYLIPESPSWLVQKSRYDEARNTMCQIFGTKEITPEVEQEIETLIQSKGVKTGTSTKTITEQIKNKLKYLMQPQCLKPFAFIIIFFFFQQFTGIFVIVFYAIQIVTDAGVTQDPYITIVLIGLTRLVSAIMLSFISRKIGRKPLAILSGVFMTVTMISLGVYIILVKQSSDTSHLTFIPLMLLLIYFVGSTIGFLTLPFAMAAEIFPTKIRGTASGLASGFGYALCFVAVKVYPNMVDGMQSHGVFFFYGVVSLLATLFAIFMVPETKGKTFAEIQECFHKDEDEVDTFRYR